MAIPAKVYPCVMRFSSVHALFSHRGTCITDTSGVRKLYGVIISSPIYRPTSARFHHHAKRFLRYKRHRRRVVYVPRKVFLIFRLVLKAAALWLISSSNICAIGESIVTIADRPINEIYCLSVRISDGAKVEQRIILELYAGDLFELIV